jgi:choline dehydrogenase-like flavoprotein
VDGNVVRVSSTPISRDLVVVGAGVVGASVAYHAARAGAAVTLVDAGRPQEQRWTRITEHVDRLITAGATVVWVDDCHHVTMADPEGNEFDVC